MHTQEQDQPCHASGQSHSVYTGPAWPARASRRPAADGCRGRLVVGRWENTAARPAPSPGSWILSSLPLSREGKGWDCAPILPTAASARCISALRPGLASSFLDEIARSPRGTMADAVVNHTVDTPDESVSAFVATDTALLTGRDWPSLAHLVLKLKEACVEMNFNSKVHAVITDGTYAICIKPRDKNAVVWTTDYKERVTGYPEIASIGTLGGADCFVFGSKVKDSDLESKTITLPGGTLEKFHGEGAASNIALDHEASGTDHVWIHFVKELKEELGPAFGDNISQGMCHQWIATPDLRTGKSSKMLSVCITAVFNVASSLSPGLSPIWAHLTEHRAAYETFRTGLLGRSFSKSDFSQISSALTKFGPRDEVAGLAFLPLEELAGVRHLKTVLGEGFELLVRHRDERDRMQGLLAGLLAERIEAHAGSPDLQATAKLALDKMMECTESTVSLIASCISCKHDPKKKADADGWIPAKPKKVAVPRRSIGELTRDLARAQACVTMVAAAVKRAEAAMSRAAAGVAAACSSDSSSV